jgi:NAD+ kinase
VKRVGLILKPGMDEARQLADELVPGLVAAGHAAVVVEGGHVPEGAAAVPEERFGAEVDMAVLLGGDGTMLAGSALVADHGVPVLGINLGHLGFLTQFDPADAGEALRAALAGELGISERMRLEVTCRCHDGTVTRAALNDAVIHQGEMARLIELEARLDGHLIASYRSDGLIVATPTGSTAYNLAAGGPIIMPGQRAMTLTPICAHALTMRPLVIPQEAVITLTPSPQSRGVVLTVDGQWSRALAAGEQVDISAAAQPLRVFDSEKHFFDILREKLHWGARSTRAPNGRP